jgi:hypothetical protein
VAVFDGRRGATSRHVYKLLPGSTLSSGLVWIPSMDSGSESPNVQERGTETQKAEVGEWGRGARDDKRAVEGLEQQRFVRGSRRKSVGEAVGNRDGRTKQW